MFTKDLNLNIWGKTAEENKNLLMTVWVPTKCVLKSDSDPEMPHKMYVKSICQAFYLGKNNPTTFDHLTFFFST